MMLYLGYIIFIFFTPLFVSSRLYENPSEAYLEVI